MPHTPRPSHLTILFHLVLLCLLACPAPLEAGMATGEQAFLHGDHAAALEELLPEARQGVARAQHIVGLIHILGKGVEQDFAEAGYWFRKAAEAGYHPAQFELGLMYELGEGFEVDLVQAARWYTSPAAAHHPEAAYRLARMYSAGKGVERDYVRAVELYLDAAEQEHVKAMANLAVMYHYGLGTLRHPVKAWMWAQLAAERGSTESARNREIIAREMTPSQLAEATRLAEQWHPTTPALSSTSPSPIHHSEAHAAMLDRYADHATMLLRSIPATISSLIGGGPLYAPFGETGPQGLGIQANPALQLALAARRERSGHIRELMRDQRHLLARAMDSLAGLRLAVTGLEGRFFDGCRPPDGPSPYGQSMLPDFLAPAPAVMTGPQAEAITSALALRAARRFRLMGVSDLRFAQLTAFGRASAQLSGDPEETGAWNMEGGVEQAMRAFAGHALAYRTLSAMLDEYLLLGSHLASLAKAVRSNAALGLAMGDMDQDLADAEALLDDCGGRLFACARNEERTAAGTEGLEAGDVRLLKRSLAALDALCDRLKPRVRDLEEAWSPMGAELAPLARAVEFLRSVAACFADALKPVGDRADDQPLLPSPEDEGRLLAQALDAYLLPMDDSLGAWDAARQSLDRTIHAGPQAPESQEPLLLQQAAELLQPVPPGTLDSIAGQVFHIHPLDDPVDRGHDLADMAGDWNLLLAKESDIQGGRARLAVLGDASRNIMERACPGCVSLGFWVHGGPAGYARLLDRLSLLLAKVVEDAESSAMGMGGTHMDHLESHLIAALELFAGLGQECGEQSALLHSSLAERYDILPRTGEDGVIPTDMGQDQLPFAMLTARRFRETEARALGTELARSRQRLDTLVQRLAAVVSPRYLSLAAHWELSLEEQGVRP